MILHASSACTLASSGKAQAMVAETNPQAAALGYKAAPSRVNTLLARFLVTATYIKLDLVLLLVISHYLVLNKSLAQAGNRLPLIRWGSAAGALGRENPHRCRGLSGLMLVLTTAKFHGDLSGLEEWLMAFLGARLYWSLNCQEVQWHSLGLSLWFWAM